MAVIYRRLSVAEFRQESPAILQDHYEELTRNKDVAKLAPAWNEYEANEKKGRLFALSCWDEGIMVGYSVFIMGAHLHYRDMDAAFNDVLYLSRDYRGGMTGIRLIRECESYLRGVGIKKIFWHIKKGTILEGILPRLGYEHEETVVAKIL